jgi:IBR domain, a half RING-finger domain/RING-type zinc-finger/RNA recognition motif. (a.k.a. RRM, RBD, or RNP domain)
VRLSAGFDVRDIITGFETHWVFLDNIPVHVTTEDINPLLQPFGRVMDVKWRAWANSSTKMARVRLSTPAEARQACIALDDAQVFDTTISTRLPVNDAQKGTVFQDTAVRVQWTAPSKVAYGGYSTMERANKAIEAARIPFRDHLVKASVHVGLPVVGIVTVRFQGVPSDANEGDMERFAHPDDVVWERPNYSSLPHAVNGIKRILEEDTEPLSFDVLPPPYKNGATVCAWAHFRTPADAKVACNRLHGRRPMFTGKSRVFVRHFRSLSYSLSPTVYEKLEKDLQLLRSLAWFRGRATISVVIRFPPQPILVKLSGEDIKELGQLKSEFERILKGEIVRQDGKVAWDGFFARPAGNTFITELERANPGVTIQRDVHRRMIRLLGSAQNRGKVREKLLMKLHELRSQHIRTLPLDGRLIGLFLRKDLMLLREELGFENVNLDIDHQNLQIRGNDIAYETAREAIIRARSRHPEERPSNIAECPVCFNQVTARITLPCGHSWCRGCLKDYLTSSIDNKYFPLTCLASEAKCTERIPLNLAREILAVSEFDAVVNAAFTSYVQSRPDEFHYCPSPDCPQIYRMSARDTVLQCPSCLLRLCPNCHVEAHDGFACPESGDSLFQKWMKNHDVKNCPGCKIPIERAEGCNHMTCTQCQTHICWVCLQTFPRGEGIYDHMRSLHGGIGLGPVF